MREFVLTLRYEARADQLMDQFIEHPEATATSTTCSVTGDSMWRVEHLHGPEAALDAIEGIYTDEDWCNECLHDPPCDSCREFTMLDNEPTARAVYGYREEIERCKSIPYLTVDELGDGVLFETERSGNEYRWRILLPQGGQIGELYDRIDDRLREGIELDLQHVGECTAWRGSRPLPTDLSFEQLSALNEAVESGYYASPRETTVEDLAGDLDVPRSTLQYRLQRAEAQIMRSFVDRWKTVIDAGG